MLSERNRARILAVLLAAVAALGPLFLASGGWSPPRWFGSVPRGGDNGVASLPGGGLPGGHGGAGIVGSGATRTVGERGEPAGQGAAPSERGRLGRQGTPPRLPGGAFNRPGGGGESLGPEFLMSCGSRSAAAGTRPQVGAHRSRPGTMAASRTALRAGHGLRAPGLAPASAPKHRANRHSGRTGRASQTRVRTLSWSQWCGVAGDRSQAPRHGSSGRVPGRAQDRPQWWDRSRYGDWRGDGNGDGNDGHGNGHGHGNGNGHGNGQGHHDGEGQHHDNGHHYGDGHGHGDHNWHRNDHGHH